MSPPTIRPEKGVPLGRVLIILSVFAIPGLIFLGVRHLGERIKIVDVQVAGDWQSSGKPWHIVFRPDKTIVSSTGPSQPAASQAWISGPGTYSVDYFGTLWVTLNNGKVYSAGLTAANPNRFDLIESDTLVPTVFERVPPPKPKPPDSP